MHYLFTIAIFFPCVFAHTFIPCPGHKKVTNIVFNTCTETPCIIVDGHEFDVKVEFDSAISADKLTNKVLINSSAGEKELILSTPNDLCLTNLCPVETGQKITALVKGIMNSNVKGPVIFTYYSEDTHGEYAACAIIPIIVAH